MAKKRDAKPKDDKPVRKGPGAGRTFTRTDYGVSAELFVTTWEQAETVDDVFEALKAHSEHSGRPIMPRPIIVARAAEYRAAKVPLKRMPRVTSRDLDVQGLNEVVAKIRGKKSAAAALPAGFTAEQFEAVVEEVLRRLRARL